MIVVGLTGGIASGKSFVGGLFRRLGIPVVDADQLSRQVVQPGTPGFDAVSRNFPAAVTAREIDRSKLGRIVFSDPVKRKILEDIIHPLVREEFLKFRLQHEKDPLIVYEVPLLFEKGLDREMDYVVVVDVPVSVQKERLQRRSGLTEQEAEIRIASQWDRDQRNGRADFLLSGLLTEKRLEEAIGALLNDLRLRNEKSGKEGA